MWMFSCDLWCCILVSPYRQLIGSRANCYGMRRNRNGWKMQQCILFCLWSGPDEAKHRCEISLRPSISRRSVKKERIRLCLLSLICLFHFYVPVISATWAKYLWGNWCVSWKWCRAADRWATLIRLCVFKWKGIYLREWPKAGVKHRNGEDFLFSKSQGRATSSRAHSDPVATQSALREF